MVTQVIAPTRAAPGVQTGNYNGPLDVLVALVEKADISIYDVSIADITDQYLLYLEKEGSKLSIEAISEFQLMAAYLMYLKARMLFPKDKVEEEETIGEREEFIELLLRYHRYRKLAEVLANAVTAPELFRNSTSKLLPHDDDTQFSPSMLLKLQEYYEHVLKIRQIYRMREPATVNTKTKQEDIAHLIKSQKQFSFYEIIKENKRVIETICTFLALLQMAKNDILELYQEHFCGDIMCFAKGNNHE